MTRRNSRRRAAPSGAVLAVLVVGCSSETSAPADSLPADTVATIDSTAAPVQSTVAPPATSLAPEVTTAPTTAPPATVAPTTAPPTTTSAPSDEFDPSGATVLAFEGRQLDPGKYLIPTLGTPITAEVGENWAIFYNWDAETKFAVPEYELFGDREVRLIRPNLLSDPVNLTAPALEQTPWPVDDIDGWLDSVIPGVVRGEPTTVQLGDVAAIRFDVRLDDVECGPDLCAGFATNQLVTSSEFLRDVTWRVWWIDQGQFDPIAIVAGAGFENEDFLEAADELVESMRFGEPQPNPLGPPDSDAPIDPRLWEYGVDRVVPAGPVRLPTSGGIEFDLPIESRIFQRTDIAAIIPDDGLSEIDIWVPSSTSSGVPIESADDLVGAITDLGLSGFSVAPVGDGSVFDLRFTPDSDDAGGAVRDGQYVVVNADAEVFWSPSPFMRLWVVDTDAGLVAITAESDDEAQLSSAVAIAEGIAASIAASPITG